MDKIGKYKIVSKIGQGATSHVYKGKDETLGRFVAVKTIAAEVSKDETLRKRFRDEAEYPALLYQPIDINDYDIGEEQQNRNKS